jgi:hypothetical protein
LVRTENSSMQFRSIAILISTVAISAGPLLAHHYDRNMPVTLNGTVRKVEWGKPEVKIHLGVVEPSGKTRDWEIQTAPAVALHADGSPGPRCRKATRLPCRVGGIVMAHDTRWRVR